MVKQLAVGSGQLAMEFSIFCSNKDLDGSVLQGVAFDEWVPGNANTKTWYSSSNNILPVLKQAIKKEKPDHLFITGIYDWQFNFKPLLFCRGVKKIISARGMLHPGALSQKSFKKRIYLQLWKMLGLHTKHTFHATDEAEKRYIQDIFGNEVQVKVAANFPHVLPEQEVIEKKPGLLKLASIALVSPMKNILLVLEALADWGAGSRELLGRDTLRQAPRNERDKQGDTLRQAPRNERDKQDDISIVEYNIYGPVKDERYWEECEALIKKLPATVKVRYHGDIPPAKIAAALAACHVFILPSKSENFGHSLYEALSAGRPVITSNNTPWVNLEAAKAGINVSLNDTNGLQEAIVFFAAMDLPVMQEWSKGARHYAEEAVDLDAARLQYLEMFG